MPYNYIAGALHMMVWAISESPATHFSRCGVICGPSTKSSASCAAARNHTIYLTLPSNALVIRYTVDMSRLLHSIPELEPHLRPPCRTYLNLP